MVNWHKFVPTDFEYDFEKDKLAVHSVTFEEAVQCFFSNFEIRRNKSYEDRYQLSWKNVGWSVFEDHLSTQTEPRCSDYYRMADMKKSQRTDEEIDEMVIAQADDETAWEEPVFVKREEPTHFSLSPEIATRAAFLARLHKATNVEKWLQKIIEERVDFEEAAFVGVKQAMTVENGD